MVTLAWHAHKYKVHEFHWMYPQERISHPHPHPISHHSMAYNYALHFRNTLQHRCVQHKISSWILTSCWPHRVTSGCRNSHLSAIRTTHDKQNNMPTENSKVIFWSCLFFLKMNGNKIITFCNWNQICQSGKILVSCSNKLELPVECWVQHAVQSLLFIVVVLLFCSCFLFCFYHHLVSNDF